MAKLKKPLGRLGRLFHRLQDLDYELIHIAGEVNFLPDFLSRAFPDPPSLQANFMKLQSTINWHREQQKDREIRDVIQLVLGNGNENEWSGVSNGRRWFHERRQLYVFNNILRHGPNRIVCPQHMKPEVLKLHHDSAFAGHRGFESTFASIRQRYYWNFMPSEVKAYCQSCKPCQDFNYSNLINKAPLKPVIVSRPWQIVSSDFMGPFKRSSFGNVYIITCIDHFTKFMEAAAVPSFDAETTATFIFNNIICRYGMVEQILTDQGVNYESRLIKQLCSLVGSDKLRTSTYHAPGNGTAERPNKTLKPNIAKFVNDKHDDWDRYVQLAISAYNNSFHSTIKMTPYEALFGRKSVIVADVILNNQLPPDTKLRDISEFVKALRSHADFVSQVVRENTLIAKERQKANYDRFIKCSNEFKVGDYVKINNCRRHIGLSKAFEPKFIGSRSVSAT